MIMLKDNAQLQVPSYFNVEQYIFIDGSIERFDHFTNRIANILKSRGSCFTLVGSTSLLLFSSSLRPRPAIFNTKLPISVPTEIVVHHLFTTVFISVKALIPFASALIVFSKALRNDF